MSNDDSDLFIVFPGEVTNTEIKIIEQALLYARLPRHSPLACSPVLKVDCDGYDSSMVRWLCNWQSRLPNVENIQLRQYYPRKEITLKIEVTGAPGPEQLRKQLNVLLSFLRNCCHKDVKFMGRMVYCGSCFEPAPGSTCILESYLHKDDSTGATPDYVVPGAIDAPELGTPPEVPSTVKVRPNYDTRKVTDAPVISTSAACTVFGDTGYKFTPVLDMNQMIWLTDKIDFLGKSVHLSRSGVLYLVEPVEKPTRPEGERIGLPEIISNLTAAVAQINVIKMSSGSGESSLCTVAVREIEYAIRVLKFAATGVMPPAENPEDPSNKIAREPGDPDA